MTGFVSVLIRVSFAAALALALPAVAQPYPVKPDDPKFNEILDYMEWVSDQHPHKFRVDGDEIVVDPGVQPDILALPLAGPWLKFGEAIDYALKLKPKMAFSVHDMILHPVFATFIPRLSGSILEPRGTRFFDVELDQEYEF